MSDVEVRTMSTPTERDGLFEMAAGFVGGATRLSLSLASLPLTVLPSASRRRARQAIAEVARAIVSVPKEIGSIGERVVEEIYEGGDVKLNLPNVGDIADRARNFTERLSRAAEEFGAGVGRVADRAGSDIERVAAKVDEWTEAKPKA